MFDFLKNNKKAIILIIIVSLVVAVILIYRRTQLNKGVYEPDMQPVKYEIIKYEDNEYNVMNINESDVYRSYYKHFIRLLLNDPVKAYEIIDSDTKNSLFNNNYEEFIKYINKLDKKVLLTSDVSRYSVNNKQIIIVDTTEASYVFNENGVWNFTVHIMGN